MTTISALTTEIVKGNGNLAQLSARGNYRAITAADMGKIYSRNVARQQLYVSKFPQKSVKENQYAEPLLAVANIPDFEETKIQKILKNGAKKLMVKNQGNGL